jgi:hypothetical protein
MNNNWYILCVFCLLAASRFGVELISARVEIGIPTSSRTETSSTPTLLVASRHNTHKVYQLYIECPLMMSKYVLERSRGC